MKNNFEIKKTPENNIKAKVELNPINSTFIAKLEYAFLNKENEIIAENNFQKKDEFHVTILGFQDGLKILELKKNSEESDNLEEKESAKVKYQKITDLIDNFSKNFSENKLQFSPKNEYGILQKDYEATPEYGKPDPYTRSAFVRLLNDNQQIDNFLFEFRNILGEEYKKPFPHITLAGNSTVRGDEKTGIFIGSEEVYNNLVKEKITL